MIVASEHSANNHLHHINNLSALHDHTPYWGLRGGRHMYIYAGKCKEIEQ